jgi:hypothetical protein
MGIGNNQYIDFSLSRMEQLHARGISTAVHYPTSIHQQPFY